MNFLRTRSDEISSIVGILGLVVGIIGFGITIHQLYMTQRTLRAANTYQNQSDATDLIDEISSHEDVDRFLSGNEEFSGDKIISKKIWKMFNFYLSVYRQGLAGGLSDEFQSSFAADFCSFVSRVPANSTWVYFHENGKLSSSHLAMSRNWCGG